MVEALKRTTRTAVQTPEQFDEYAGRLSFWYWRAMDLKAAADVLYDEAAKNHVDLEQRCNSFGRTGALLLGLAFENALKGLILLRSPGCVSNGKIKWGCSHHDLSCYARQAGEEVPPDMKDCFGWLTNAVVWSAKYQVTLESEKMTEPLFPTAAHRPAIDDFFRLLVGKLNAAIMSGRF